MTDSARTIMKMRGLKENVAEAKDRAKGQDGVSKRSTSLKTAKLAEGATEQGLDLGVTRPSEEQLSAINMYTRSPKTADEVAVFTTLSCNDLVDRDDDMFTTQTVKDFAALAAPLGPNGKSFMVGHDYTKLPVGRIFDTGTAKVEDGLFMTNGVYVPNTEQYKSFLENQDYGIYWAVSVGVMLDSNTCNLDGTPMSQWGGFCYEQGHYKGSYYDPDGETDKWGYAVELQEGDKKAVKCIGLMQGARDFYELSQVFLGAQFYAALADKSPAMAGVIKAAGARHIPVIGLSAKEAAELPSLASDPKVVEALKKFDVEHDSDGDMRWTDDDGFNYVFSAGEVLCLGKVSSTEKEVSTDGIDEQQRGKAPHDSLPLGDAGSVEPDARRRAGDAGEVEKSGSDQPDHHGQRSLGDLTDKLAAARVRLAAVRAAASDDEADESPTEDLLESLDQLVDDAGTHIDAGEYDEASALLDAADSTIDDLAEELGITLDDPDDDNTKAVSEVMSKKAVLTAAVKASVPASILTKVSEAADDGLSVLLGMLQSSNKSLTDEKAALAPKAALGDAYIKQVRDEALEWYIKANSDGTKGVQVDTFKKVLDACGEDVDLVRELRDEQEKVAKSRFGVKIVRTTMDSDPHERPELQGLTAHPSEVKNGSDARVRKLHG